MVEETTNGVIGNGQPFSTEWKERIRALTFSDYNPNFSYEGYFSSVKIFDYQNYTQKKTKITEQKINEILGIIADVKFSIGFNELKEEKKREIVEAILTTKNPSLFIGLTEEEKDEIIKILSTNPGFIALAEKEKKREIVEAILTTKFPSLFIGLTEGEKEEIIKMISSTNPRFIALAAAEKKEIIEMIKNGFAPGFTKLTKEERKVYFGMISALKENKYIIDIPFLETLDKDKKIFLAKLFMNDLKDKLGSNFIMGKSLLIWMIWLFTDDLGKYISQIKGSESFDPKYFIQAYNFLYPDIDTKKSLSTDDLFSVIIEHNLIKNLDKNVLEIKREMAGRLGTDFSFHAFHAIEGVKNLEYKVDEKVDEKGKLINKKTQNDTYNVDSSNTNNKTSGEVVPYKKFNIYLDTPTSICLFYNNNPVAIVSFYIKNGTEFIISQIQEIPYKEYDRDGNITVVDHAGILDNNEDRKNLLYDAVKSLSQKHGIGDILYDVNKTSYELN